MAAMHELAGLAEVAATVLRHHPDAPEICSVGCGYGPVRLQLAHAGDDSVYGVARWAVEWRTVVRLTASGHAPGRVLVTARMDATTTDGPTEVEVWTYVATEEVAFLGLDLPVDVEVPVSTEVVLSHAGSTVIDDRRVCDG